MPAPSIASQDDFDQILLSPTLHFGGASPPVVAPAFNLKPPPSAQAVAKKPIIKPAKASSQQQALKKAKSAVSIAPAPDSYVSMQATAAGGLRLKISKTAQDAAAKASGEARLDLSEDIFDDHLDADEYPKRGRAPAGAAKPDKHHHKEKRDKKKKHRHHQEKSVALPQTVSVKKIIEEEEEDDDDIYALNVDEDSSSLSHLRCMQIFFIFLDF